MEFINAQQQKLDNPNTFDAPSQDELDAIKLDDSLKVCIGGERFWTTVTEVKGQQIKAIVDNHLINCEEHGLDYGDEVEFNKHHIYDIY